MRGHERESTRRSRRGPWIALLAALVLILITLVALPDREGDERCGPRGVTSWSADTRLTGEFARYGDDSERVDDWTGGDGTHSVRLPDGRLLWLFSDTYLGAVNRPRTRQGSRIPGGPPTRPSSVTPRW